MPIIFVIMLLLFIFWFMCIHAFCCPSFLNLCSLANYFFFFFIFVYFTEMCILLLQLLLKFIYLYCIQGAHFTVNHLTFIIYFILTLNYINISMYSLWLYTIEKCDVAKFFFMLSICLSIADYLFTFFFSLLFLYILFSVYTNFFVVYLSISLKRK